MTMQYLFGYHTVLAKLQHSPQAITKIIIQQQRHDQRMQAITNIANKFNIPISKQSKHELDTIAKQQRHQGIIAECQDIQHKVVDLDEILDALTVPPFLLILDGIQDPHNLGACLRTADAAGVHAVICPKDRAVGLTTTVEKVACGAAETVPLIQVTNLARTMRELKDRGIWLYGAAVDAEKSLYDVDLNGATALVLGAEEKGLRQLTQDTCDELFSLPMHGYVASLNVSVATGICLYEALRQRK